MEHRNPSFNNEPFFDLLGSNTTSSSNVSSSFPQNNFRRSENQDHEFGIDDVLPSFDYQPIRRSGSANSASRLNSSSSGQEGSLNSSKSRQASSLSPSTVYVKGEPSELWPSTLKKEIDMDAYHAAVVTAVERTMKKYADNLLRVLEGMSGRLSQLESVTQGLEHSVKEVSVCLADNHGEADGKLRMLSNHLSEVHRTVQLLRDKQEIAEAHAELAKLQLSKGEASGNNANSETVRDQSHADATSLAQQMQHQLSSLPLLPAPQQLSSLPQSQAPILHQQAAVVKTESTMETNIQQPTSLPSSSYSTAQQLQSYYPQNAHMQQSQPLQLQASQPSLPQVQNQQSLPQQPQIQQSMPQQPQIQQPAHTQHTHQLMPHHAQNQSPLSPQQSHIQQSMPQHAQIQQPLPQQAQTQQSMPQHTQIQQPLSQQSQIQLPMQHQLQIQQPLPQQGQIQQPMSQHGQTQQPLPQALHSQHSIPMQPQSVQQQMPPQSQSMQQPTSQIQMQQVPGSHMLQSQLQPNVRGPFQQYTHQPESHSYGSLPQGQALSVPGSYSAEQSPYAAGNYAVPQQQLLSQSGSLAPQQQHAGSHAYDSSIQKSNSSLPLANLAYDSSGVPSSIAYGGSVYRGSQPVSTYHTGYPRLPSAQPVSVGSSSPGFPQAAATSVSGGNLPVNRASVDDVIERVAAMGFSRDQVRSVVRKLIENGQSVDLNVVLDKLMNGGMEEQSQRSWYGR